MTPDLDIYRVAQALIKQHGEDAPSRAAQRADELLADGDVEGHATWVRIVKAVRVLLDDQPPGAGDAVH
jgi:hypothetical protein